MSEKRHISQLSDDEFLALYHKHDDNAAAAAREVGCGASTFRNRVRLLQDADYISQKDRKEAIAFLMEELEARGIDPRSVKINRATVKMEKNRHEGFYKDKRTQKAHVVPMKNDKRLCNISFSPKFEDGPKWPLIQPATPLKLDFVVPKRVANANIDRPKRVFFWPDTQIGFYRHVYTEERIPFHDEAAIKVALQMLEHFKADEVVIMGDFVDLASMSRWVQYPEFQRMTQPSIQYAYQLLREIRKIVGPSVKIVYIPGNHERRLAEYVAVNAKESYGMRPAESDPDKVDPVTLVPKAWKWPHYHLKELLLLDQLNIEYGFEYPSGRYWLTKKLVAQHQPDKKTDLRATLVHGHIPHAQRDSHTVHYHDGAVEYDTVAVPGLMRVDDITDPCMLNRSAVPSNRDRHNWQQGVATAIIFAEDRFNIEVHRIRDGVGWFRDLEFKAKVA